MSDQPICDSQPLCLPAGKRDGQVEIGCLEMLRQGHSVTGSLRDSPLPIKKLTLHTGNTESC